MPSNSDKSNTSLDWLADRLLRGLIASLKCLPYTTRLNSSGWIFRQVLGPLTGYRKRALENLAMIYPEMDSAKRKGIAAQVLDNFGRTFIENYDTPGLAAQLSDNDMQGPGMTAIAKAKADGRPVIFTTGHFGNHDVCRVALDARGYTIGALYRPMSNRNFNSHYEQTLANVSGPIFPQGPNGTRGFIRYLRQGGMVVLLVDVFFRRGAAIDFLGKPAQTSLSAAELALRFDALLVPYFAKRNDDDVTFTMTVEAPIEHTDALTMTTEITKRLETYVIDKPGQWFWVHRRWKK